MLFQEATTCYIFADTNAVAVVAAAHTPRAKTSFVIRAKVRRHCVQAHRLNRLPYAQRQCVQNNKHTNPAYISRSAMQTSHNRSTHTNAFDFVKTSHFIDILWQVHVRSPYAASFFYTQPNVASIITDSAVLAIGNFSSSLIVGLHFHYIFCISHGLLGTGFQCFIRFGRVNIPSERREVERHSHQRWTHCVVSAVVHQFLKCRGDFRH